MWKSGLDWASRDLTKWLSGQLAIGHWRLLKPSKVTLKDSEVNKEDHKLISEAGVGVILGLFLGTGLRPIPELGPGPTPEADLGIVQEPRVKATIMVTYRAYVPGPQMNHHPEEE